MEFTAKQIADLLGGKVDGNSEIKVSKLAKIEEGEAGALSFLANPKYTPFVYTTKASVVIIASDFKAESPIEATLIRVENPYESFAKLLSMYNDMQLAKSGIEQPCFIDPTARVADDAYIGAFAYIGKNVSIGKGARIYPNTYIGDNASVGADTTLFAGVKVYHNCQIGANCTLHAGVVIGADGFGFAPQQGSAFKKVAQIGNVVIEDHVEIGPNTTIDRATLGSTLIRNGVKLDNLIQVAHNVEIGQNTVIAAQTGIAGSTKIGSNCMIGGQVGILGHITIGDNVKVAAQSGVGHSLIDGEVVQGSPAFSVGIYKRSYVMFRKLPDLEKRISDLEQKQFDTNPIHNATRD